MTDYTTNIKIGTAIGSMVFIESLNDLSGLPFPPPYVRFYPYQSTITNIDGSVRALGLPHFTLDFGVITEEQRDLLQETYCADAIQSRVYASVPTNNNAGEYKTFLCWLNWPNEGELDRNNDYIQKLVIECTEAAVQ